MLLDIGEPIFPRKLGLELDEDCCILADPLDAGDIRRVSIKNVFQTAKAGKELVRKGIGIPARKRIKKQQFKRFVLLKNLEAVF